MLRIRGKFDRVLVQKSVFLHQYAIFKELSLRKREYLESLFLQSYETKIITVWYILRNNDISINYKSNKFLFSLLNSQKNQDYIIIKHSNNFIVFLTMNALILARIKLRTSYNDFTEKNYLFIKSILTKFKEQYFSVWKLDLTNNYLIEMFVFKLNLKYKNFDTFEINHWLKFLIIEIILDSFDNYIFLIEFKLTRPKFYNQYNSVYLFSYSKQNIVISQIGFQVWVKNQVNKCFKPLYSSLRNGFIFYEMYSINVKDAIKFLPCFKIQYIYMNEFIGLIKNTNLTHYELLTILRVHRLIWLRKSFFCICDSAALSFLNYKMNNILKTWLLKDQFLSLRSFKFCNFTYSNKWVFCFYDKYSFEKLYLPQLHWLF